MSFSDLVRRRPSPHQVGEILAAAEVAVDTDGGAAVSILRRLGGRPWWRAGDNDRISYGFALRSYAAWKTCHPLAWRQDARNVVAVTPGADPLLPLVPVLASAGADAIETEGRLLAERFGGCGRAGCGHPAPLEAALSIIAQATDAGAQARWALRTTAPEHRDALRVAAHRRAWLLGDRDEAEKALEGASDRLREARARLRYDLGDHWAVLEIVPPDHELAVRSSLAVLLSSGPVPEENLNAVRSRAAEDPCVAALLAEADGRLGEAASSWRRAGDPTRAWECAVIADPRAAGDPPPGSFPDAGALWYAHAAGNLARPDAPAQTAADHHNLEVAEQRADLATLARGAAKPTSPARDERLSTLGALLESISAGEASPVAMLRSTAPDADPGQMLAAFADAEATSASSSWDAEAWDRVVEPWPPLPRRADPLVWLASRRGRAIPSREAVMGLRAEARLPVLAAAMAAGADWALADAVASLGREALQGALPQALPDLPALAGAVASCGQVDGPTRLRASVVAAAALANGVERGAWDRATAEIAARRAAGAVADVLPDPDHLTAIEALSAELEALDAFSETARRRAVGPVLTMLADLPAPGRIPKALASLYDPAAAEASLLLKAGRPDAARRHLARAAGGDTALEAEIGLAMAERLQSAGRAAEALHELGAIARAGRGARIERALLDRVAAAVVRDRGTVDADLALADAEQILRVKPDLPSLRTMTAELLLARANGRPGSAALDVPDLERALTLDPAHPVVIRALATALVVRAMDEVESRPAQAVADVDRATDLYMADAQLADLASKVALHAGAILWSKQRNRAAAAKAVGVSLAINPNNPDALAARRSIRGF